MVKRAALWVRGKIGAVCLDHNMLHRYCGGNLLGTSGVCEGESTREGYHPAEAYKLLSHLNRAREGMKNTLDLGELANNLHNVGVGFSVVDADVYADLTGKLHLPIMTMGPICITPELKRQGYGKKLLDYSLEKAAEYGCGALCFEGNINFYGKSGFTFAREFGIRYHGLPEGADSSFFLCKELIPGYLSGVTGEYAPPQGYFVNEEAAEEFDKQFPYKEKQKLPGQLF